MAEIEPLGVVPEHRGRRLAGALCLAVAARVADLGGREVFINTGPRLEYPAPGRAYAKVGFEAFDRARSGPHPAEHRWSGLAMPARRIGWAAAAQKQNAGG